MAPDGSFTFQNPKYPNRRIAVIYDSVHVLKNFRNNWVNQKDSDLSFFYPNFQNFSIIQQAQFKELRDLYHAEKHKMIKQAPKLNMKTIYPTNFDRQRVGLVLNIIHESTIATLYTLENVDTAQFLEVISIWFTIINNRSIVDGIKDRNKYAEAITSSNCYQVDFLKRFVSWLEAWEVIEEQVHVGGLTKDTFNAAGVCTRGIIQLIVSSFISCDIEYFLPGKFQTIALEKRFGRYRELSGCNYNVSVKQIIESEKKLRVRRLIKTYPHELKVSGYSNKTQNDTDISHFTDLIYTDYLNEFTNYDHSSFLYVCGYGCYAIYKKISCDICIDLIIKSKGSCTDTDYFDHLQRGGLIVPTENCVQLLLHMNALFDALRKNEIMRRKFQLSNDPQNILVSLTIYAFLQNNNFVVEWYDSCLCGTTYSNLFTPLLSIYANILLNNYRKKINDFTAIHKMEAAKSRKKKKEKAVCEKRKAEAAEIISEKKIKLTNVSKNRKASIYKKI